MDGPTDGWKKRGVESRVKENKTKKLETLSTETTTVYNNNRNEKESFIVLVTLLSRFLVVLYTVTFHYKGSKSNRYPLIMNKKSLQNIF